MRVHFDGVNFESSSGPNTFAQRLAKQLFNDGIEVTFDGPSADVSLVFIEPTGALLADCTVQRLDGIWCKPQEFATKNVSIKAFYDRADAVVFQSRFDKNMVERWWGSNEERQRRCETIGNGIDVNVVKQLTIPKLIEMRGTYEKMFVCSANWHPQKRLRSNVQLFEHIRATQHPNSCLLILGDHPDFRATGQNVFYAGSVTSDVYMEIYSAADWMLHLAYGDHCANTVVEALSQGTPVVCSEVGGTQELIGHGAYGFIMKERAPYNLELYDYDDPPKIDVTQCSFLPTRQELDRSGIPSIDIKDVAKQYVRLFEDVLRTSVEVVR